VSITYFSRLASTVCTNQVKHNIFFVHNSPLKRKI